MKKQYKAPTVEVMGKLIYKTKGSDANYNNDAGGRSNGSKPNVNK